MSPAGRHLLHVFPGFDAGGTQMRAVQLMGMLPPGTRHTVLAMDGRFGCMRHVPQGVEVTALPPPPPGSFLATGRYMRALLDRESPDGVLTSNWGSIEMLLGVRLARLSRGARAVPLIHQEDGFGPEEAHRYLRRRIWLRRCLLGTAAAVAVPSRLLADLAVRRWRQPKAKVHHLPNGVDLGRFRGVVPQDGAPSGGGPGRPLVVGTVGHLRPEKHQALLLRAFARCGPVTAGAGGDAGAGARLLVVGDGPMGAGLRSLAQELGIGDRVEFVGNVDDTAPVYRRMDLFALSSDTEQMPLTVLEAMASGLPIVATDVGDIAHMLHPDNRPFLAPRGDVEAFASRLGSLLVAPERRAALGAANRLHCAAHFDRQSCYRAWVELYEAVFRFRT